MNRLGNSTSLYLLQHAHNPVHWWPWCDEAWQKAKEENKPVLVSIGYSACHWCHVMEKEVFEKQEAAAIMNEHFICIKVDREERPDVDHLYMLSLQLMAQQGGWPLNCFCLPDGRPIYGGTYFPLMRWNNILGNIVDLFQRESDKLYDYAEKLQQGLTYADTFEIDPDVELHPEIPAVLMEQWKDQWDERHGGESGAPKFPLPNNWMFGFHFGQIKNDSEALEHVHWTLEHIIRGGIYDHIGGGLTRYSVDDHWKVPHFEKMLYDNAQFIQWLAQAYRLSPKSIYRETLYQTFEFLQRELKSIDGLYYAALDADSEGEEGRYYIWSKEEVLQACGEWGDYAIELYRIEQEGLWEHHRSIPLRLDAQAEFRNLNDDEATLLSKQKIINERLLAYRSTRVRPGCDTKELTSWNSLLIPALCEAFDATGDDCFLKEAIALGKNILLHMRQNNGSLWHAKTEEQSSIDGFLDDYAFLLEGLLALGITTSDEEWFRESKFIVMHLLDFFYDEEQGLFWYSSSQGEQLFLRKKEWMDNVIPSANSSLCRSLFKLSHLLENPHWEHVAERMIKAVHSRMTHAGSVSNWLMAHLEMTAPFAEVIITGSEANAYRKALVSDFFANTLFMASTMERSLPVYRDRFTDKTAIYVCIHKTCYAPVFSVEEARVLLNGRIKVE